jgi:hypothetical protein
MERIPTGLQLKVFTENLIEKITGVLSIKLFTNEGAAIKFKAWKLKSIWNN